MNMVRTENPHSSTVQYATTRTNSHARRNLRIDCIPRMKMDDIELLYLIDLKKNNILSE